MSFGNEVQLPDRLLAPILEFEDSDWEVFSIQLLCLPDLEGFNWLGISQP